MRASSSARSSGASQVSSERGTTGPPDRRRQRPGPEVLDQGDRRRGADRYRHRPGTTPTSPAVSPPVLVPVARPRPAREARPPVRRGPRRRRPARSAFRPCRPPARETSSRSTRRTIPASRSRVNSASTSPENAGLVEAHDEHLHRPHHRLTRARRSRYSSAVITPVSNRCCSADQRIRCRRDGRRWRVGGGRRWRRRMGRRVGLRRRQPATVVRHVAGHPRAPQLLGHQQHRLLLSTDVQILAAVDAGSHPPRGMVPG